MQSAEILPKTGHDSPPVLLVVDLQAIRGGQPVIGLDELLGGGAVLPPHAVGRDYLPDGEFVHLDEDSRDLHVTLRGLLGFSVGVRSGIEVHFLGLVAGLDLARPGIKVPALGRIGI